MKKKKSIHGGRVMRLIRLLMAMVTLGLVVGLALWETTALISPGPLHASHAEVPELQGGRGCIQCHGKGGASMADSCAGCHDTIENQFINSLGLHGRLDRNDSQACGSCHREHVGGMLGLVTDFSFHAAGIPDRDRYDHRHVETFGLVGFHEQLECWQCHSQADAVSLLSGERRFIGLTQECTTCHEDVHDGVLKKDCASCHGQSYPFDQVAEFEHDSVFPLIGGHDERACKQCHESQSEYLIEEGRSTPRTVRKCSDCHGSPHRSSFIKAVEEITRQDSEDNCSICHEVVHASFLGSASTMPPELHAATGFPLETPHQKVDCVDCHASFNQREGLADTADLPERFLEFYPGRERDDCKACHGDPHEGQFETGFTEGRCVECHASTHFLPSAFEIENHANCQFPLTGGHRAVSCAACHEREGDMRLFVPTGTACGECHEDEHDGEYDLPDKPELVEGRAGCARCHVTSTFMEVRWSSEAHLLWTGEPLKGAHATANCTDCHARSPKDNGRGWSLGEAPTECHVCHEDPHMNQFLRPVETVTDCVRCHHEALTFQDIHFDHQQDARFALDEHHITLDCDACHKPYALPSGGSVVRYKPLGIECRDCHDTRRLEGMEQP